MAVRNEVIEEFKAALFPHVKEALRYAFVGSLGDTSSVYLSNIDIWLDNFAEERFNWKTQANTSKVEVSATNLEVHVKGVLHFKVNMRLWSSWYVSGWEIWLHQVGVRAQMEMRSESGKLQIEVSQLDADISPHRMDRNIDGALLRWVVDWFKGRIIQVVRGQLASNLPSVLSMQLNSLLASIPYRLSVGQNLTVTYEFGKNPVGYQSYFQVPIGVEVQKKGVDARPIHQYNARLPGPASMRPNVGVSRSSSRAKCSSRP